MDFYKKLNYSLGNEDWSSESQALNIKPSDRVLCVTASGDRPLHLVMQGCDKVISIDMNKIQNYLLELKLIAIQQLDFEKYVSFLGLNSFHNRFQILLELKNYLSKPAFEFWYQQKKQINSGIIYQGAVERLTKGGAVVFNLLMRKTIKKLFSIDNLSEQQQFIKKEWTLSVLKKIFECCLNPKVTTRLIKDPGLYDYLAVDLKPGKYIFQRMLFYLENHLAKDSPLLHLILTGKVEPNVYYPYLTYEGYCKIRESKTKLFIHTDNIVEWIHRHDEVFDAFSMSDISSYMSQIVFEKLLKGIYQQSTVGARFCIREFLSKRYIPQELEPYFQRNVILEKKLEYNEPHFIYRFMVGNVMKSC